MKVRKKPIVVDAWRLNDKDLYNQETGQVPVWVRDAWLADQINYYHSDGWHIKTLEGDMIARNGDYLIRGIMNELYPASRGYLLTLMR